MEQKNSIENTIRRIEYALREYSLSDEQISSLKHELGILNQELEKRNKISVEERQRIPNSDENRNLINLQVMNMSLGKTLCELKFK
jgi:flagellar motility protein MotE (MotC chaperone)